MQRAMALTLVFALNFNFTAAMAQPQAEKRPADHPIPDTFTNLQVLPKDIAKHDLMNVMKDFLITMKVRCSQCHAVSDDLTEGSFSSDDKETMIAARDLLRAILAKRHDLKPVPQS